MVVLDTDFLIDVMRANAGAVSRLEELLDSPDPVGVSAVTVMQLYHGVARSRIPEREADKIERALKGVATYDLTREIAARAGRLDGEMAASGDSMDPADVMIGCTALHRGEPVVTRNARDFGRIKGLSLIAY